MKASKYHIQEWDFKAFRSYETTKSILGYIYNSEVIICVYKQIIIPLVTVYRE